MSKLSFRIVKSIKEIPQQDWVRLFGEELLEGYGFHKTMEDADLHKFEIGYLEGVRNNKTVAIIPFFLTDFSFDIFMPEFLRKAACSVQRIFKRFLRISILFLGSPTAEEYYPAFSEDENLSELLGDAVRYLRYYCRKNKIDTYLFNNISRRHRELIDFLETSRFIKLETVPTTRLEIKARSLEEFISGLGASTRKDLRRKIRKAESAKRIHTVVREDISDILDDIYMLYLNNLNDSEVSFEELTPKFFENIRKNMPGAAKYFITYDKDKIVAFNLVLVKGDTCIDKFIGFDREASREYSLYYLTFLHNIEWCIKNGIRYYQPGTTDYHPKVRLGAKLVPLYLYADSPNFFLRLVVSIFAPFIQPKKLDPSLNKLDEFKDREIIEETF